MNETGTHYLMDILALLLATVVVVPVFHTIRLGAILGYLTAGAILGPWGLAVITEVEEIRHLGEFGVIFLLFVLGIELKPEKLWQMRKLVLGLGSGQLLITAAVLYIVALLFSIPHQTALIIGFGLSLSSTAFCLNLLAERGGISTIMGKRAFSILLFQDLSVVPLLAFISILAGGDVTSESAVNLLYALSAVIALLLAGKYLLNPILGKIVASQDPDVLVAVAVLLVLGVAWIMQRIGLTMALGAFLAGLMLAESHYRHQIEADILPFRGILLGLFFMTVGMGFNFGLLWNKAGLIICLTIGLMVIKSSIIYLLVKLSGARHNAAIQTGFLLSQSGEFGFVMFGSAASLGLLDNQTTQILVLIIALSMILTPFIVKISNTLLLTLYTPEIIDKNLNNEFINTSEKHVVLAGFGRVGARIGNLLTAAGVPYIAIEKNQKRVQDARDQGFPVFYGDACNVKVLRAAGADHARMIVIALDHPKNINSMISLMRQYYPDLPIHTRARDREHCANLTIHGATTTVSETLEISLKLAEEALLGSELNEIDVKRVIDEFREDYYSDVVKKVSENKVVMGELRH